MVIFAGTDILRVILFAEEAAKPVLERLDPPRRAAVVMALLGLVLTGLLLVACVMLGGHWVRRMARHRPGGGNAKVDSASESRQLRKSLEAILPDAKSSETIYVDRTDSDTRIDT
jgi:hypothetical protein